MQKQVDSVQRFDNGGFLSREKVPGSAAAHTQRAQKQSMQKQRLQARPTQQANRMMESRSHSHYTQRQEQALASDAHDEEQKQNQTSVPSLSRRHTLERNISRPCADNAVQSESENEISDQNSSDIKSQLCIPQLDTFREKPARDSQSSASHARLTSPTGQVARSNPLRLSRIQSQENNHQVQAQHKLARVDSTSVQGIPMNARIQVSSTQTVNRTVDTPLFNQEGDTPLEFPKSVFARAPFLIPDLDLSLTETLRLQQPEQHSLSVLEKINSASHQGQLGCISGRESTRPIMSPQSVGSARVMFSTRPKSPETVQNAEDFLKAIKSKESVDMNLGERRIRLDQVLLKEIKEALENSALQRQVYLIEQEYLAEQRMQASQRSEHQPLRCETAVQTDFQTEEAVGPLKSPSVAQQLQMLDIDQKALSFRGALLTPTDSQQTSRLAPLGGKKLQRATSPPSAREQSINSEDYVEPRSSVCYGRDGQFKNAQNFESSSSRREQYSPNDVDANQFDYSDMLAAFNAPAPLQSVQKSPEKALNAAKEVKAADTDYSDMLAAFAAPDDQLQPQKTAAKPPVVKKETSVDKIDYQDMMAAFDMPVVAPPPFKNSQKAPTAKKEVKVSEADYSDMLAAFADPVAKPTPPRKKEMKKQPTAGQQKAEDTKIDYSDMLAEFGLSEPEKPPPISAKPKNLQLKIPQPQEMNKAQSNLSANSQPQPQDRLLTQGRVKEEAKTAGTTISLDEFFGAEGVPIPVAPKQVPVKAQTNDASRRESIKKMSISLDEFFAYEPALQKPPLPTGAAKQGPPVPVPGSRLQAKPALPVPVPGRRKNPHLQQQQQAKPQASPPPIPVPGGAKRRNPHMSHQVQKAPAPAPPPMPTVPKGRKVNPYLNQPKLPAASANAPPPIPKVPGKKKNPHAIATQKAAPVPSAKLPGVPLPKGRKNPYAVAQITTTSADEFFREAKADPAKDTTPKSATTAPSSSNAVSPGVPSSAPRSLNSQNSGKRLSDITEESRESCTSTNSQASTVSKRHNSVDQSSLGPQVALLSQSQTSAIKQGRKQSMLVPTANQLQAIDEREEASSETSANNQQGSDDVNSSEESDENSHRHSRTISNHSTSVKGSYFTSGMMRDQSVNINLIKHNKIPIVEHVSETGNELDDFVQKQAIDLGIDPLIFLNGLQQKVTASANASLPTISKQLSDSSRHSGSSSSGISASRISQMTHDARAIAEGMVLAIAPEVVEVGKILTNFKMKGLSHSNSEIKSLPRLEAKAGPKKGYTMSQTGGTLSARQISTLSSTSTPKLSAAQIIEELQNEVLEQRKELIKQKLQLTIINYFLKIQKSEDYDKMEAINKALQVLESHDSKLQEILMREKTESQNLHFAFMFASPLVITGSSGRQRNKVFKLMPTLNFTKEFNKIYNSVEQANQCVRITKQHCTVKALKSILDKNPIGLHFSGHGLLNTEQELGKDLFEMYQGQGDFLLLETEDGNSNLVSTESLKAMISDSKNLQFVVVASCHSEFVGKIFVNAGAKHVICIYQAYEVQDDAVITFTDAFYSLLLEQKQICKAFKSAKLQVSLAHGQQQASIFKLLTHDKLVREQRKRQASLKQTEHRDTQKQMYRRTWQDGQAPVLLEQDKLKHQCQIFGPFMRGSMELVQNEVPLKHSAPRVSNLVGRTVDKFLLIQLIMNSKFRLKTVVGHPGVGKSALVLSTLEWMEQRFLFSGGLIYLNARQITDSEELTRKLCQTFIQDNELQFENSASKSPIQVLRQTIITKLNQKERETLMVIDNAEDVIREDRGNFRKLLCYLLQAVKDMKIVLTARTALANAQMEQYQEEKFLLKGLRDTDACALFKQLSRPIRQEEINNLLRAPRDTAKYPYPVGEVPRKPRKLDEHHLFKLLNGNPLSIILVAPVLSDGDRCIDLVELYKMLTSDTLNEVLRQDGMQDQMKSLYMSARLSVEYIIQHDEDTADLFFLLGMIPAGLVSEEMDEVWGALCERSVSVSSDHDGEGSQESEEGEATPKRDSNSGLPRHVISSTWERCYNVLLGYKLVLAQKEIEGERSFQDGKSDSEQEQAQNRLMLKMSKYVQDFAIGSIQEETWLRMQEVLGGWLGEFAYRLYVASGAEKAQGKLGIPRADLYRFGVNFHEFILRVAEQQLAAKGNQEVQLGDHDFDSDPEEAPEHESESGSEGDSDINNEPDFFVMLEQQKQIAQSTVQVNGINGMESIQTQAHPPHHKTVVQVVPQVSVSNFGQDHAPVVKQEVKSGQSAPNKSEISAKSATEKAKKDPVSKRSMLSRTTVQAERPDKIRRQDWKELDDAQRDLDCMTESTKIHVIGFIDRLRSSGNQSKTHVDPETLKNPRDRAHARWRQAFNAWKKKREEKSHKADQAIGGVQAVGGQTLEVLEYTQDDFPEPESNFKVASKKDGSSNFKDTLRKALLKKIQETSIDLEAANERIKRGSFVIRKPTEEPQVQVQLFSTNKKSFRRTVTSQTKISSHERAILYYISAYIAMGQARFALTTIDKHLLKMHNSSAAFQGNVRRLNAFIFYQRLVDADRDELDEKEREQLTADIEKCIERALKAFQRASGTKWGLGLTYLLKFVLMSFRYRRGELETSMVRSKTAQEQNSLSPVFPACFSASITQRSDKSELHVPPAPKERVDPGRDLLIHCAQDAIFNLTAVKHWKGLAYIYKVLISLDNDYHIFEESGETRRSYSRRRSLIDQSFKDLPQKQSLFHKWYSEQKHGQHPCVELHQGEEFSLMVEVVDDVKQEQVFLDYEDFLHEQRRQAQQQALRLRQSGIIPKADIAKLLSQKTIARQRGNSTMLKDQFRGNEGTNRRASKNVSNMARKTKQIRTSNLGCDDSDQYSDESGL